MGDFSGIKQLILKKSKPYEFWCQEFENVFGEEKPKEEVYFEIQAYIQYFKNGEMLNVNSDMGNFNKSFIKIYTLREIENFGDKNIKVFIVYNNVRFLLKAEKGMEGVYFLYECEEYGVN